MTALAALCAYSPARAALALLCGEVAARSAMVLTLAYGKPADERPSTAPFVGVLGSAPRNRSCAGVASAAAFPASENLAPLAARRAARCLDLLRLAASAFDGIGGDVVGATGEVCRAVVLVAISAML